MTKPDKQPNPLAYISQFKERFPIDTEDPVIKEFLGQLPDIFDQIFFLHGTQRTVETDPMGPITLAPYHVERLIANQQDNERHAYMQGRYFMLSALMDGALPELAWLRYDTDNGTAEDFSISVQTRNTTTLLEGSIPSGTFEFTRFAGSSMIESHPVDEAAAEQFIDTLCEMHCLREIEAHGVEHGLHTLMEMSESYTTIESGRYVFSDRPNFRLGLDRTTRVRQGSPEVFSLNVSVCDNSTSSLATTQRTFSINYDNQATPRYSTDLSLDTAPKTSELHRERQRRSFEQLSRHFRNNPKELVDIVASTLSESAEI